jgi:CRP-like cAMP-binding protein
MRSRTVTAVTECELCYLTRQSIMKLSLEYPELRARLRRCVAVVAGFSDTRPV